MVEIQLLDGVKLLVDEEKFSVVNAVGITLVNSDDTQLSLDLNIRNILEDTETSVKNIFVLRSV